MELIVDRIEGDKAVILVGDKQYSIPLKQLPPGIKEGMVLEAEGQPPIFQRVSIDEAATDQRLKKAARLIDELFE